MTHWECRLAATLTDADRSLIPAATRARAFCRQRRYGSALEVLWTLLQHTRRAGSARQEAFVLIHIGHVYRHTCAEIAQKFFQDGLHMAQGCGFRQGEMLAHDALGELHYQGGHQERALTHYRLSLATARALRDRTGERDILLEMVNCYEERGEFNRCDELLEQALQLDEQSDEPTRLPTCALPLESPVDGAGV